jgi:hypothetical protein
MFANHPRWILFQIGYFPPRADEKGIYFQTRSARWEELDKFVSSHEWLVLWWVSRCIGTSVNLRWYYQRDFHDDAKFLDIKTKGRQNFKNRLVAILDECFFTLIDHDLDREELTELSSIDLETENRVSLLPTFHPNES